MLGPENRLGETLIEMGAISSEQLTEALAAQKQSGEKLGETLIGMGVMSHTALVKALAERLGVPGVYLRHGLIDPAVAKLVEREETERLKALPMFKVRNRLIVSMAEPQNLPAIRLRIEDRGEIRCAVEAGTCRSAVPDEVNGETALIRFTSGSTGHDKGVIMTRQQQLWLAAMRDINIPSGGG